MFAFAFPSFTTTVIDKVPTHVDVVVAWVGCSLTTPSRGKPSTFDGWYDCDVGESTSFVLSDNRTGADLLVPGTVIGNLTGP